MQKYHSIGVREQRRTSQGIFRSFFILNADWPCLVSKQTVLIDDREDHVDEKNNLEDKN